MRIVIDMQGAQTPGSRNRGIGRYTISLVKELVLQRGEHEIVLVLNGLFSDSIEPIRALFDGLLPQSNIMVWQAVGPLAYDNPNNISRRHIAELSYEAFLVSQHPDLIYITSLFEGLNDDAITSIHQLQQDVLVAVTLYDLIPFINPDPYLLNPDVKSWYMGKIEHLRKADLCLAISESARQEGIVHLGFSEMQSINVSTDANEHFRPVCIPAEQEHALRTRYGLFKSFVMYTGGIDHRKNVEGLIRAYALLPKLLRAEHQLAIVCSVSPSSLLALQNLAHQQGLEEHELVLTGYVPEEDLVALYNLCKLFVFPSWHEGFGLPALEAMRCGAAVIGANTSSLPEVIGWSDALFDPYSDKAISSLIERALTDESFRNALIQSGTKQARLFSWCESARKAINAMESVYAQRVVDEPPRTLSQRSKLAYVSPLPGARSGIADYSADLLPALARHYDIDVIVEQIESLENPWIQANCTVRSSTWLLDHAEQYDRVLYHFGNSPFHQHMFNLLDLVPGVVVLHDFFLAHIQSHRDMHDSSPNAWAESLFISHGYKAVQERFTASTSNEVLWRYPANLPVLQRALGVVVHSQNSLQLAQQWYGENAAERWQVLPLVRTSPSSVNQGIAKRELGLSEDTLLVCCFGLLGPTKLNHRLLQAWMASPLVNDPNAYLVFVGQTDDSSYSQSLLQTIASNKTRERIKITGWADAETYRRYLVAADIGVQLRTMSRGETSAAALDCMNYNLATIVNAHGSMEDLDPQTVYMLSDDFEDAELSTALTTLARDFDLRQELGRRAGEIVRIQHSPKACAERYFDAIEQAYGKAQDTLPGLLQAIAKHPPQEDDLWPLANCLSRNFPPTPRRRQLLIDISVLVQNDAKTGIQRVVHAILREWLSNPPEGFQVEPVYSMPGCTGYRYARGFTCKQMGIPHYWVQDEPVEAWQDDIFVGLDLAHFNIIEQQHVIENWRLRGVQVWFVVYDLLPIQLPGFFEPQMEMLHRQWLEVIGNFDGLLCISRSVADEAAAWMAVHGSERLRPLKIKWFHLGANLSASAPTSGMPKNGLKILTEIRQHPTFLMVGTVEPRKGHEFVVDAFEALWQSGQVVNLVIVGKQGWKVEALVERLRNNHYGPQRLIWLDEASDEYLEQLYEASTCLIAASYGEGYGLPLIEAAQHKLPILARDIPVFREVAGEYASYFSAETASELSSSILNWLTLYEQGKAPSSENMPWLTWRQSAQQLLQQILPN